MTIHQRRRERATNDQACWPSFYTFCNAFCAVFTAEHQVCLNDFMLLRSVGKGAFGKVRVVKHKKTRSTFALKYINKKKCLSMSAFDNIIEERRLLEAIENAFICNLRYAFQDDENLFLVLDFMLGGDLRFHMNRIGELKEDHISLMVAEISLALDYLHSMNIIHRDIKPDNIVLCENGHAHLTDFNIAVRFKEGIPLTAVAGSMAYMAPEILAKCGYFNSIDWWSLGVSAFEMATAKRPFRGKTTQEMKIAILTEDIPSGSLSRLSPELSNFIYGLLTRDINKRLGTNDLGGFQSVKSHPVFRNLDWTLVSEKKTQPIYIPDSNFDATHELEELLLEDKPLMTRQSEGSTNDEHSEELDPFIPTSAAERALRIMESRYEIYDFTKPNNPKYALENRDEFVDLCGREEFAPVGLENSSGEGPSSSSTSFFFDNDDLT